MKKAFKNVTNIPQFPSLVLCFLFFAWNAFMVQGFIGGSSLRDFLEIMVPLSCIAIGVTVTIIAGGIDISTGALVSTVNCAFVVLLEKGFPLFTAILLAIGLAAMIGLVNGVAVAIVRINALLVTISTSTICLGLALWIRPIAGGAGDAGFLAWYNEGSFLGLPNPLFFFIIIPLAIWYVIKATPLGTWLYATGENEKKAYESGIKVVGVQIFAYLFSSVMAGIAAIAFSGNIVGGDPKAGLAFTLNALAAAVVGGASLTGGKGDAIGGLFGGLFISLVTYAILGAQIDSYFQELASGLVILLGVVGMMAYNLIRSKTSILERGYK